MTIKEKNEKTAVDSKVYTVLFFMTNLTQFYGHFVTVFEECNFSVVSGSGSISQLDPDPHEMDPQLSLMTI